MITIEMKLKKKLIILITSFFLPDTKQNMYVKFIRSDGADVFLHRNRYI